jgi:hypothetical protein
MVQQAKATVKFRTRLHPDPQPLNVDVQERKGGEAIPGCFLLGENRFARNQLTQHNKLVPS